MPQTDFIKLVTSHLVGAVIAIGGPLMMAYIFLQTGLPLSERMTFIGVLGPIVGIVVQFLFQTNTQAAARAQTRNDILTEPPA